MGAILKNGAVFLHVPKTGGNWVIEILKLHDLLRKEFKHKHSDTGRLQVAEKKVFYKNPFIFCFVRHPVSWMESWWRYQKKRNFKPWGDTGNFFYHPCAIIDSCQDEDFNKFVSNVIDEVPGFVSNMFFQFTKNCDVVGRQENLKLSTFTILNSLKMKIDYTDMEKQVKINVSKKYPIVWDKGLKKEFQKYEVSGMKQYGYSTIN